VSGDDRVISTYPVFNQTYDEPAHLARGNGMAQPRRLLYEAQHPPLRESRRPSGRTSAARAARQRDMFDEGRAILGEGAHYRRMLLLARLGMLPFFVADPRVVRCGARASRPAGRALGHAFAAANPNLLATPASPAPTWLPRHASRRRCSPGCAGASSHRRRALLFGVVGGLATVRSSPRSSFSARCWCSARRCACSCRADAGTLRSSRRSMAPCVRRMRGGRIVVWGFYGSTSAPSGTTASPSRTELFRGCSRS
jgi:hypothetical protein